MEKIIDFHAHVFPDKIALKAARSIGDFYDIPMEEDGTLQTLIKMGDTIGVCHYLIHSVATRPDQVEHINTFVASAVKKYPDKFTGYGTIHPDYENIEGEIERMIKLGLKGVKIHPDFQKFNIDDPSAMKIYEVIEGRLPILVHTGDYRYDYSHPRRMAKVIDAFPKLDVIGAHFGGWSIRGEAVKYLLDKKIWVDSSSSLYDMTPKEATELVRLWGAERIFFGTDYPMWRHDEELERFNKLDLTEKERSLILYENAKEFLKL